MGLLATAGVAGAQEANINFYKAKVEAVQDSEIEGDQSVTAKITNGDRAGEVVNFSHEGSVYVKNDWRLSNGNDIYLSIQRVNGEDKIAMTEFDRSFVYALMGIMFLIILLVVGLFNGVRALLGFGLLSLIIGFYLVPQILGGSNPLTVVYVTSLMVVVGLSVILTGFSRKTILIIASSVFGLLMSSVIIFAFGYISHFNVIGLEDSNFFALSEKLKSLDLLNIIYGGMLLGALGAMMDVSMSIVAGIEEILSVSREKGARKISGQELFFSGLNIGREIMAVNANTLLLAYIGSAITLWLIALSQDVGLSVLVSFNMVFVEVLRIIGGTLGIFLSIPMTAWLASKFLVFKRKFEY